MKYLKRSLLLIIVSLVFTSCETKEQKTTDVAITTSDKEATTLIINLTSDATENPHGSLMGMHLAQKALKNGVNVSIFLNVNAVKLMLPTSESISFQGENLQDVLKDIMDSGGKVLACPHCMEVHEVKETDLMVGVKYVNDNTLIDMIKLSPTVFTY
jgi:predicted peroxiredoxin